MIKIIFAYIILIIFVICITLSVLFKYGDDLIGKEFAQYNESQNAHTKSGISTFTVVSKKLSNCEPLKNTICIGSVYTIEGSVYKVVGLSNIKNATFFAQFKKDKAYTCYWEWGHYGWQIYYCYDNI